MSATNPEKRRKRAKAPAWAAMAAADLERQGPRVLLREHLDELLQEAEEKRLVPRNLSLPAFLQGLIECGALRQVELKGVEKSRDAKDRRPFKRYVFGTPSAYAVALSLRPRSYLSHGSAIVLNELTERTDLPVYINQEQSPKPRSTGILEQSAIDRAFRNPARSSTYIFRYEDADIVLLNGKNTGNYGVTQATDNSGSTVQVTSIARTLVDIAVRPAYAGGPDTVLDAYRRALNLEPVESLIANTIQSLDVADYVYPYHQLIGFYFERAGASRSLTGGLRSCGVEFDFYVDYHMRDPTYDPRWRMYYPSHLS
jgi:hypothetical protein